MSNSCPPLDTCTVATNSERACAADNAEGNNWYGLWTLFQNAQNKSPLRIPPNIAIESAVRSGAVEVPQSRQYRQVVTSVPLPRAPGSSMRATPFSWSDCRMRSASVKLHWRRASFRESMALSISSTAGAFGGGSPRSAAPAAPRAPSPPFLARDRRPRRRPSFFPAGDSPSQSLSSIVSSRPLPPPRPPEDTGCGAARSCGSGLPFSRQNWR
mmetsp:Transcript_15842/g.45009  ORF Transcript_15842/g.45009 Transcript_15842/m.45009 type:complete len:213 (-) Transcript_15842:551-1189(-)